LSKEICVHHASIDGCSNKEPLEDEVYFGRMILFAAMEENYLQNVVVRH
jgi:hypothetical protein